MRSCISRTIRGPAEQGENGLLSCSCRLSGVGTPYPLKRVLSPFSTGLGDSFSSSPSRGTQIFVLPCDGCDEQEQPSPGEKGRGTSRTAGGWVFTPTIRFIRNLFTVSGSCRQSGVGTPYPLKRVLSPFQGDTNFCPSLKGKGDQPYGWWIGFYTDQTNTTVCKSLAGVGPLTTRGPYQYLDFQRRS